MRLALALLTVVALSWPTSSPADPRDRSEAHAGTPASRTYGTASKAFVALSPWHFVPISSDEVFTTASSGQGFMLKGDSVHGVVLMGPLTLPDGSLVTEIQGVFCDTSNTSDFQSRLFVQPRIGSPQQITGPLSDIGEAPGCVDRTTVLGTPIQVDNSQNTYYLLVNMDGDNTRLSSMRVGYRLHVSAPGAQVFNDVPPGHPFFQFIQALAASGITSGCSVSPPLFCPDSSLTRGQMAAFLAKALGLHFAD